MRPRMNSGEIEMIQRLRQKGFSLPEISRELNIPKTTIFRYIKDVEILPEYLSSWAAKRGGSRARKILSESRASNEAKYLVTDLSKKEKILFLCALYWAEGNKKDLILTNTDPNLIRVFMNAVRDVLDVSEERFKISLRLYEDLSKEKSLLFWSEVTKIPKEKFLSIHILPGKKKGKLEYGMCRVRITKGGELLKKIVAINKVVTELLTNRL